MSGTPERFSGTASTEVGSDRSFGLVFTAFFLIIGLLPLLHGRSLRVWALGIAGVFVIAALFAPRALALPNRLWARFGALLNRIVSPIALGILFYGVVTPIGRLMRLFGKDPLRLKFDPEAKSYWIVRAEPGPSGESLKNQF